MKTQAIMVYTGRGRYPMPWGFTKAVRSLDTPEAEDLARYAKAVVDEMYSLFPFSWGSDLPIEQAMKQAIPIIESTMAERHPELSAEAIAALAWMWSYSFQK